MTRSRPIGHFAFALDCSIANPIRLGTGISAGAMTASDVRAGIAVDADAGTIRKA